MCLDAVHLGHDFLVTRCKEDLSFAFSPSIVAAGPVVLDSASVALAFVAIRAPFGAMFSCKGLGRDLSWRKVVEPPGPWARRLLLVSLQRRATIICMAHALYPGRARFEFSVVSNSGKSFGARGLHRGRVNRHDKRSAGSETKCCAV